VVWIGGMDAVNHLRMLKSCGFLGGAVISQFLLPLEMCVLFQIAVLKKNDKGRMHQKSFAVLGDLLVK